MCATTLDSNEYTNNSATADGGALYCNNGSTTVSSSKMISVFTTNSANGNGGAIAGSDGSGLVLSSVLNMPDTFFFL